MTNVRETRRADELKPGDWTAPGGISALAAEVLYTLTYPHPGDGGGRTHLVLREFGITLPFSETYAADYLVGLASAEELDNIRAGADRAKQIADIRALAAWLEANPSVPMPVYVGLQVSPGLDFLSELSVWNSGAEGLAELKRLAGIMGEPVREVDDERTDVAKKFGDIEYKVVAWHRDGRPAEPVRCVASLHVTAQAEDARCFRCGATGVVAAYEPEQPSPADAAEPLHAGDTTEHGLVDETPAGLTASGLTPAADQSRGPLAGTTPVVTYFSFGHGQSDPGTGKSLLDHYVTVVAPTYEACREAMFASRFGRAWSFDYLAGTARATEWIARWTEHEVIVAPGTDPTAAEAALKAAAELLADEDPFDAQDQAGRGVSW